MPQAYRTWVHYGDNEWTQHISEQKVAQEAVAQYPDKRPILVHVQEHAGWGMTYWFDEKNPNGISVGSANDRAVFTGEKERVRQHIGSILSNEWEHLPEIRRPNRAE